MEISKENHHNILLYQYMTCNIYQKKLTINIFLSECFLSDSILL